MRLSGGEWGGGEWGREEWGGEEWGGGEWRGGMRGKTEPTVRREIKGET